MNSKLQIPMQEFSRRKKCIYCREQNFMCRVYEDLIKKGLEETYSQKRFIKTHIF